VQKPHWSTEEIDILKKFYSSGDKELLKKLLPSRTWSSIEHKARREQTSRSSVRTRLWKQMIPTLEHDDAVYLAGLIDGEGMITINFYGTRPRPRMRPLISIANTDKDLITWVRTRLGGVTLKYRGEKARYDLYTVQIARLLDVKSLLEQILPFLKAKKKQAELVLKWCEKRLQGTWRDYDPELFEIAKEVRSFHHKGSAKMRE
jgi:hypothetical protein